MADGVGEKNRTRPKRRRRLNYFYLNGHLHRVLHVNRGKDIVTAWNYPEGKVVKYNWTDTLRRHKTAFMTIQVARMLNRRRLALERAITRGDIPRPQFSYSLDENRHIASYMWSEEDIFAAHEYFSSVHYGHPRKDGLVTPKPIPTPRELRAMMNDEEILYVKEGDRFVPTWKANI